VVLQWKDGVTNDLMTSKNQDELDARDEDRARNWEEGPWTI